MNVTKDQIAEVITSTIARFDADLFAKNAEEIASEWFWKWDDRQGADWNTYKFSDVLELQKSRWRRWEEHHNGPCCVVERVRDKYVMPRVREFLAELNAHAESVDAE